MTGGTATGETPTAAAPDAREDFVGAVLDVVASIPSGRVMTYGDVAAVLGSRAARAVGTTMARYGSEVPWWRVVRASGAPPTGHEAQALPHYEAEGTPLTRVGDGVGDLHADAYRVRLATARWSPFTD